MKKKKKKGKKKKGGRGGVAIVLLLLLLLLIEARKGENAQEMGLKKTKELNCWKRGGGK